jgi:type I restriction enzyme M protein
MGKTNSLNDEDPREFVSLQATFAESEKSWLMDIADVDPETFDLSVKNPNKAEEAPLRDPLEILEAIALLDAESAEILAGTGGMLRGCFSCFELVGCTAGFDFAQLANL